ncbi:MAG: alpha/beta hydrolase-fold protein [Bacteroidota bacterium]
MQKSIAYTFILKLFLVLCFDGYSQNKETLVSEVINIGKKHTFFSEILDENREIWVKLPTGYDVEDTTKYPVVYLLDGSNNFLFTAGLLRQLESRSVPKSILVGIVNTNRSRDLTPAVSNSEKTNPSIGGADNFLKMLEKELIPFVQKNYRATHFKTLIGHSFGGLFIIHTLATKPELFNAYLAISPSLWWDNQMVVNHFAERLKATPDMKGLLYLTMANERGKMLGGMMKLMGVLETESPKNLRWDYKIHSQEHHGSVPIISTLEGFQFFYKDWHIPSPYKEFENNGLKAFENRAERIRHEFGENWSLSNENYADFLYELHENKLFKEELELSLQLIEEGKKEVEFYESAGKAYHELNDEKNAAHYYKEAYKLNPGYVHVNKILDSLEVDKKTLMNPVPLKRKESETYTGKYTDGEVTCTVNIIDDSLSINVKELYSNISAKLASMGKDIFYIHNGYYTFSFIFNHENKNKASHILIRGTNGWIKKLAVLP